MIYKYKKNVKIIDYSLMSWVMIYLYFKDFTIKYSATDTVLWKMNMLNF